MRSENDPLAIRRDGERDKESGDLELEFAGRGVPQLQLQMRNREVGDRRRASTEPRDEARADRDESSRSQQHRHRAQ